MAFPIGGLLWQSSCTVLDRGRPVRVRSSFRWRSLGGGETGLIGVAVVVEAVNQKVLWVGGVVPVGWCYE